MSPRSAPKDSRHASTARPHNLLEHLHHPVRYSLLGLGLCVDTVYDGQEIFEPSQMHHLFFVGCFGCSSACAMIVLFSNFRCLLQSVSSNLRCMIFVVENFVRGIFC
jgi:hypothetical protein